MFKFSIKKVDLLWLLIFNVFLFQNKFNSIQYLRYLRYTDEIVTIFLGAYTLLHYYKLKKIDPDFLAMYLLMGVCVLIGLLGNSLSGVSRSITMIALDIMYLFKVFVCFVGASLFFNKQRQGNLLRLMAGEITVIVWIAFACLLVSQVTNIGMTRGVRYGIKCFLFVYSSAGMFSQYCIIYLVILTAGLAVGKHTFFRRLTLIVLCVVWLSTCRSRAFVMVAIWAFLYIMLRDTNFSYNAEKYQGRKALQFLFRPQNLFIVAAIALILGSSAVDKYFGDQVTSARSLLLKGGVQVMKDYFPLGAGFATFGTEPAATYYSPLYARYGLNRFWALAKGGSELTDCYWPAIFGELGIIGLIFMVILIYLFVRKYIKLSVNDKYFMIATVTYIAYMLFSSTATGIFCSYVTAEFIVIIVAIMNSKDVAQIERKEA